MVGLVDDSFLVGLSLPSDVEHVVTGQRIGCDSCYCSRETVLTVFCHNGQLQNTVTHLFGGIDLIHPTRCTTSMQTILIVVDL